MVDIKFSVHDVFLGVCMLRNLKIRQRKDFKVFGSKGRKQNQTCYDA
jgi:hypothetical protein